MKQSPTEHNDQGNEHTVMRAVKRRGLIAGAATLVVAALVKQFAEPVAAAYVLMGDTSNPATTVTTISSSASIASTPILRISNGVASSSYKSAADGVQGYSTSNNGIYGLTEGASAAAIFGFNAAGGNGVSGSTNGVSNGVFGDNTSTGAGVRGTSASGTGVYGSTTNGFFGVLGAAGTPVGAAGVLGYTNTANGTAFGSVVVAPATIAGYFNGEVHVEGPFYVDPISNKHGVIAHPDGTKRVFYSMEAPESWVEDFGRANLVNGHATVPLDPDFAAVIHTDSYYVFLTPYGDTNGLHVTQQSAAGFTVQEHKGGTANLTFAWRLVAKPNVGQEVARMPTYTPPPPLKMPFLEPPAKP